MKKYMNHSGGCIGADMYWETEGLKYGVESTSYSFYNHVQYSYNQKVLSTKELKEGWNNVQIAEKTLNRGLNINQSFYVRNLVSRNWFQVKNAEAIFAVSTFLNDEHKIVNGGTGWAAQMAIDNNKPVYFFDQIGYNWYQYNYTLKVFQLILEIPLLTEDFAGIGSANLNENGKEAIRDVYKSCFL
tara:strand:+ start:102030 stop:102587 length:558 start_codon:yes stop_codon:yes gene_type:complete